MKLSVICIIIGLLTLAIIKPAVESFSSVTNTLEKPHHVSDET